ncbi:hypothetical protein CHS0354_004218 [Potamilus streckersoni]|uniref:Mitochondria-eating protein n=1 Tax=Potamilus streckersoni TaxID=2493646 RepID=A0AAE0VHC7_9BIVA|nr:hypothetical protein CHS0354_004218 [Potamilus streckersoni]
MGNLLRIVASAVKYWKTNENSQEIALKKAKAENDELQRLLDTLELNCNQLRTRLSEMGAMQLTEGNPNITDLSDQNRPDKIAEKFSELYDNQWTDCYQVLVDPSTKSEQETVETLLSILKTAYDISLNRSQEIIRDARKALLALAGKSDEEPEKALETLIQETLHKMQSYRTKHFNAVPSAIAKEINEKLVEIIGQQGVTACNEYIEECVRICWLMCIKDPPMYIFCDKEDIFNKNHFMEYTEIGNKVSYVVWPVLYLYQNGPLMRKGVAQGRGEGKQTEHSNADAAKDWLPESDDSVEKKPQLSTGTKEMVQSNEDDHQETECYQANECHLEGMPIRVSGNTSEDISAEEHISEQQVVTKDVNATVAEGNSSTGRSNEDEDMHLVEAVDSDGQIHFHDVIRSQTESDTFVESSLQGVIEGLGKVNSLEGNAANVSEEEQSEQPEHTANGIEPIKICNNGGEEKIQQNEETQNQTEELHTLGNIVSTDKEDDRSCGDKGAEDKITGKDQAVEQWKSLNTDVSNPIGLCSIEYQGSRTPSTAEGAELQVDESRKQVDVGTDMKTLTLIEHQAGAGQHIPDNHCLIEEHGQDVIKENQEGETEMTDADEIQNVEDEECRDGDQHVENVLMGVHTPLNISLLEEHENELSNPCGGNSNNSSDSNNHGDDSTLKVEKNYIVQTGIANGGKIQEENGRKQGDAVMLIYDNEMELGKTTNKIFLLDNQTPTFDHAMDINATDSLNERCEETEVYVKEEKTLGVGDFSSLSETVGSGEKADDYNRDLAVATDEGVANPTEEPHNEKHHQEKLPEDSSIEGQGEL